MADAVTHYVAISGIGLALFAGHRNCRNVLAKRRLEGTEDAGLITEMADLPTDPPAI